jgi:DNA-binding response OmpR family regulator
MTAARLLVVDDDRDFAEGLAEVLEMDGFLVDAVVTGEAGIEAARMNHYDAVLIDIGLPGLNGVETLLGIKQIRSGARCFLLTGYSADHIAQQGIEAGAIEILTKPIDTQELLRLLRSTKS